MALQGIRRPRQVNLMKKRNQGNYSRLNEIMLRIVEGNAREIDKYMKRKHGLCTKITRWINVLKE